MKGVNRLHAFGLNHIWTKVCHLDAKTHTFDWSDFIKMVPESRKFRRKPLQFANELGTLFGSTRRTENDANKPQIDDMPTVNGLQSTSNSDQTGDSKLHRRKTDTSPNQSSDAGLHRGRVLTACDDANDRKLGASVEECLKSLNELRASHNLPRHLYSAALNHIFGWQLLTQKIEFLFF
ncbi:hypothetical protein MKW94_017872 [Papaver nudicaule]|uniref:Uncharacterized protein n=1 Tax=Papaver nudicaule TaxID=74823 RepID=A0AA41V5V3_PAPNU|nr:hypothetical protein [Papaver nudicaule]